MKTFIAGLLLTSFAFAQALNNSAAQQGIAIVLIFIGLKMLVEYFHVDIPVYISLLVIVTCIVASIIYSIKKKSF